MLEVATQKNNLTGTGYCFRSNNIGMVSQDDFVSQMSSYNSTLTKIDAVAAMKMLGELFETNVASGGRLELPFGTFRIVASGTCENSEDMFRAGTDDNKINVVFEINQQTLENIRHNAKYKNISADPASDAKITKVVVTADDGTVSPDLVIKAGRPLRLKGHYLAFDMSDAKQGVFLCRQGVEKKVTSYFHRGTEYIEFFVPDDTEAGEYSVKVSTMPRKDCYTTAEASAKITVR